MCVASMHSMHTVHTCHSMHTHTHTHTHSMHTVHTVTCMHTAHTHIHTCHAHSTQGHMNAHSTHGHMHAQMHACTQYTRSHAAHLLLRLLAVAAVPGPRRPLGPAPHLLPPCKVSVGRVRVSGGVGLGQGRPPFIISRDARRARKPFLEEGEEAGSAAAASW